MVLGTGTDIIEISRIKNIAKNIKFIEKMFTKKEIEYLKFRGPESTAGYFCAKEAASKAIGTGFSGFKFTDIEIVKKNNAPFILLHGGALKIANQKGIKQIHISISHCKEYATASAVAEGNDIFFEYSSPIGEDMINDSIKNNYPISIFKKRNENSHKGDYGKTFIIGGSFNMSGAMILAARAALRTGAGLVTCVIPKSIIDRVGISVIEATYLACNENDGYLELTDENIDNILAKADAIAFGIGIGRTTKIKYSLLYLIQNSLKPIVIDADGINLLADIKDCLKNKKANIILTPHSGEMARLIGKDINYVNSNRLAVAKKFAKEYKCTILLKGFNTIVTDGDRVYVNTTGNPGMASGGSGDVLTGIITSLIGQGYDIFDAAALGAYLHGFGGDSAYNRFGYGLTASDIVDFIGIYLKG